MGNTLGLLDSFDDVIEMSNITDRIDELRKRSEANYLRIENIQKAIVNAIYDPPEKTWIEATVWALAERTGWDAACKAEIAARKAWHETREECRATWTRTVTAEKAAREIVFARFAAVAGKDPENVNGINIQEEK